MSALGSAAEGSIGRDGVVGPRAGPWRILRWSLTLIGFCFACLLYLFVAMILIASHQATRIADVGIVLGGGVTNGQPSPAFVARIDRGVELYRAGRVRRLLLSGGKVMGQREESLVARDRAIAMGVPPQAILIEDKSWTTQTNIAESRKVMIANGATTAVIITEPLHMMRSLRMARDLGMDVEGAPPTRTFYQDWPSWFRFVRSEMFLNLLYLASGR